MKRIILVSILACLIISSGGRASAEATATIDVRPGNDHNYVNPKSNGVIPVALMGAEDFDVNAVAVTGLRLGREGADTGAEPKGPGNFVDLNDDGHMDVLLHFRVQDMGIQEGDTQVCLTGSSFRACDTITTIPENVKEANNAEKPDDSGNPND